MFTLRRLMNGISSQLCGYFFFSSNHRHHSFSPLRIIIMSIVILSFTLFCAPPAIVALVVHISAPKKSFPLQRAQQKCIMHCRMSQIMFQRAGNFHAKNDNASRYGKICALNQSHYMGFSRFSAMTPKQLFSLSMSFIKFSVRKIILFIAFVGVSGSVETLLGIITL